MAPVLFLDPHIAQPSAATIPITGYCGMGRDANLLKMSKPPADANMRRAEADATE